TARTALLTSASVAPDQTASVAFDWLASAAAASCPGSHHSEKSSPPRDVALPVDARPTCAPGLVRQISNADRKRLAAPSRARAVAETDEKAPPIRTAA